jgi:hypothetical protein
MASDVDTNNIPRFASYRLTRNKTPISRIRPIRVSNARLVRYVVAVSSEASAKAVTTLDSQPRT